MELANSQILAVLFDFDGVLADTMTDNFLAWQKAFRDYNIEIKKEDYFPLEGFKLIEVAKTIGAKFGIREGYENIVNLKNKYYLTDHKFSFYPGAEEIVNILREKKLLLAIVSASPREKLEKTVSKEFLGKFNVVLSGDDYERGKPFPDPYLMAAKKLAVPIERCVVVENAPLGIKSAKSAGAYCIAITSTLSREYLSEADEIIEEIGNLKEVNTIKRMIR